MLIKRLMVFLIFLIILFGIGFVFGSEYIVKVNENSQLNMRNLQSLSVEDDIINEIEIKDKLSSINGFIANLTDEQYELLKRNPHYEVYENRIYMTFLDSSIPQIRADDSWLLKENGLNLTGLHQTVCVIDSGVDYNHPNLGGCYGENDPNSECKIIGGWNTYHDNESIMDDSTGHGTHVIGTIISNHSTYKGVSPDSKVIIIKALHERFGDSVTLADGIDWCVNNASKFNITIISMSLGAAGTFYNDYCNSWDETIYDSIQSAIQNNITVVISSGNCLNSSGSYNASLCSTGISAPACIEGVIPVGAVNAADSIFYQRGELFQILAPGISIYSTYLNDGFTNMGGTSMSAPHVSGALALIKQFYSLQSNKSLSQTFIKNVLNATNIRITDSEGNGLIYPRLDVFASIISLDEFSPNITLIEPEDNLVTQNRNFSFKANLSDLRLKNATFYLWNDSDLVNSTFFEFDSGFEIIELNISNLGEDNYFWTVEAYDENNNYEVVSNFSFLVGGLYVSINYPENNSFTNVNNTNFSCSAITDETTQLVNISFFVFNSSGLIFNDSIEISGTNNDSVFNFTFEDEGVYFWSCEAFNNESIFSFTDNSSITYDVVFPNLSIVEPVPVDESADSSLKFFFFNVSDNYENLNCSLVINDIVVESKVIANYSANHNFSRTLTPDTYNWFINCSDLAGNYNFSETNSFTISAVQESSSVVRPTGGGAVVSSIIKGTEDDPISMEELKVGEEILYAIGRQVYFENSKGNIHSIKLNDIINKKVNITIQSEPIDLLLAENSSQKINLSDPKYYDLLVEVGIVGLSNAKIKIREINERNPDYVYEEQEERVYEAHEEVIEVEEEEAYSEGYNYLIIIPLIVLGLVFVVFLKIKLYQKINKGIRSKRIKKVISRTKNEKK